MSELLLPHPEFGPGAVSAIGDALLRALRGDVALAGYCREITDCESEDVYLTGGYALPALLVALYELDERPQLSGMSELDTVWEIAVLTPRKETRGSEGWLRSRLVERIKSVVVGPEIGLLRDLDGEPVTETLIAFQRVGQPEIATDGSHLRTRLLVGFTSLIHLSTRALQP